MVGMVKKVESRVSFFFAAGRNGGSVKVRGRSSIIRTLGSSAPRPAAASPPRSSPASGGGGGGGHPVAEVLGEASGDGVGRLGAQRDELGGEQREGLFGLEGGLELADRVVDPVLEGILAQEKGQQQRAHDEIRTRIIGK